MNNESTLYKHRLHQKPITLISIIEQDHNEKHPKHSVYQLKLIRIKVRKLYEKWMNTKSPDVVSVCKPTLAEAKNESLQKMK